MNFKMLSERSQTQKVTLLYESIYMKYPDGQTHKDETQICGHQGREKLWGMWNRGGCSVVLVFLFGVMEEFWNWVAVMVAQRCECT